MRFLLILGIWVMPVISASASTDEDSLRDESFGYWSSLLEEEPVKSVESPLERHRREWARIAAINAPGYEAVMEESHIWNQQKLRVIRRRGDCEFQDTYIASLQDKGKEVFKVVYAFPVCKLGLIVQWKDGFVYHVKEHSLRKRAFYITAEGENRSITNDPEYLSQIVFFETSQFSKPLHRW